MYIHKFCFTLILFSVNRAVELWNDNFNDLSSVTYAGDVTKINDATGLICPGGIVLPACFNIKDASSIWITSAISTLSYHHIQLSLSMTTSGMGSNEYCKIYYSVDDSFNWIQLNSYNPTFEAFITTDEFPTNANNNSLGIRIKIENNATDPANCYVSDAVINAILLTSNPTTTPTVIPTISPTLTTLIPSNNPTNNPAIVPTVYPTITPTNNPTDNPIKQPSNTPTNVPSNNPTQSPTDYEFCLDNSNNINGGFIMLNNKWSEVECEFCVCRDHTISGLICNSIDFNNIKDYNSDLIDKFMQTCQLEQECSFKQVGLKRPSEEITLCNCDLFQCNPQGNNANTFIFGVWVVFEAIIVMFLLM